LLGNLATVIVGFLAVPSLGNYGGGIATSSGYLVMLLFWIWKFNQINNLKYNWLIIKPTEIKSIFNLSKFGN
jgi:O-antigen/teichoic acid export membrane protein